MTGAKRTCHQIFIATGYLAILASCGSNANLRSVSAGLSDSATQKGANSFALNDNCFDLADGCRKAGVNFEEFKRFVESDWMLARLAILSWYKGVPICTPIFNTTFKSGGGQG